MYYHMQLAWIEVYGSCWESKVAVRDLYCCSMREGACCLRNITCNYDPKYDVNPHICTPYPNHGVRRDIGGRDRPSRNHAGDQVRWIMFGIDTPEGRRQRKAGKTGHKALLFFSAWKQSRDGETIALPESPY